MSQPDRPWWSVRVGTVASGVLWLGALLAVGVWAWPEVRAAWWRMELVSADPPRSLPVPVEGVEPAGLASTWGDPRSGGERRHEGIDIFAARRTPVASATRGIVVRRGDGGLGGRTVTVLGPGGWRHYYAHLQGWAGHAEGDRVARGETIGFVGTSGNAPPDAPHLHYGIYTGEGPIDPYPLLARGAESRAGGSP